MANITVLGGGLAGMTAAYEIAKGDASAEVTLYQLGWRLGGKLSTSRFPNPSTFDRIEEHGIHVMFGAYENLFYVMRKVWGPDWINRFNQRSNFTLMEDVNGSKRKWDFSFPPNNEIPGDEIFAGATWKPWPGPRNNLN